MLFNKLHNKWYFWATHCRIQPIKEAAYTIRRHWNGIVNWMDYKLIMESLKDSTLSYKLPNQRPEVTSGLTQLKL